MNVGGVNFLLKFEHTKEAKRVLSVERGGGGGGGGGVLWLKLLHIEK